MVGFCVSTSSCRSPYTSPTLATTSISRKHHLEYHSYPLYSWHRTPFHNQIMYIFAYHRSRNTISAASCSVDLSDLNEMDFSFSSAKKMPLSDHFGLASWMRGLYVLPMHLQKSLYPHIRTRPAILSELPTVLERGLFKDTVQTRRNSRPAMLAMQRRTKEITYRCYPCIKYGTSTIRVALRPDTRPSPPTWHGVANAP
jgi:hypothetical protein